MIRSSKMKTEVISIFVISTLIASSNCQSKAGGLSPVSKSDAEIVYLNIVSTVQARFATTLITSQVANRASTAKEISFTAQLPDAAFISNFSMQIDDKVIYGRVDEKEKAKADFDAAKARGESTGLVAKKPRETNAFTISVNVAAQSKVKFNLTYQEILKRVHGVYKQIINLQPNQPVSELKVDVYITERGEIKNLKVPKFGEKTGEKTNKELLTLEDEPNAEIKPVFKQNNTSSMHVHYQPKQKTEVYNGQLVVLYDVKRDQTAGDIEVVNGYFVHFFAPEGLAKRAKDIVFVLDKSGSMQGRKMEQLKDAMKVILSELSQDDTFQIIFFSDEIEAWKTESVKANPDNVKAATQYVKDTAAVGGTNIYDSLQEGIKALKKSGSSSVPMILFLTDGEPTFGETNRDKIVNDTTKSNDREQKIIIHSIGFGEDSDYNILQKISGRNRGLARRVYEDSDASLQLAGFFEEISSPVLTKLKIDYLNETVDVDSLVQDNNAHSYYDGSEVVTMGKLKENNGLSNVNAKVSGQGASGETSLVARSYSPIHCRDMRPIWYEAEPASSRATTDRAPHAPIWCCPPPHCCWWRSCPPPIPPPTVAPKVTLPANSAGGFVERMWAYQTIKKLLKENDLKDGDAEKEKAKKKALELSLKYNFVTELTSMVVVKPNENKPSPLKEDAKPNPSNSGVATSSSSSGRGFHGARPAIGAAGPTGFAGGVGTRERGPPPPPKSSTGDKKDKEENKSEATPNVVTSTASSSGCYMEIVLIKDDASVSDAIDLRRGDYASNVLTKLKANSQITGRAALVAAFSNGRGFVLHNMDSFQGVTQGKTNANTSAVDTTLQKVVDDLFGQYAKTNINVKRYVIFLVTSKSLWYAENVSSSFRNRGVVIYVVSLNGDTSSGYTKSLNGITQDSARVYNAPPSNGTDLAQVLSKC